MSERWERSATNAEAVESFTLSMLTFRIEFKPT